MNDNFRLEKEQMWLPENKDLRARAGRKLDNFSLQKSFSTEKPTTKKRKNLKLVYV